MHKNQDNSGKPAIRPGRCSPETVATVERHAAMLAAGVEDEFERNIEERLIVLAKTGAPEGFRATLAEWMQESIALGVSAGIAPPRNITELGKMVSMLATLAPPKDVIPAGVGALVRPVTRGRVIDQPPPDEFEL